jgi:hypothetical protein
MALRFAQLFSGTGMEMVQVPARYEAQVLPSTASAPSADVRSLARLSPRSG